MQPIAGEPFPASSSGLSRHVELMHGTFNMHDDPAGMTGVGRREVVAAMADKVPCFGYP